MFPYRDSRLVRAVLLIFFVLLVVYGYFKSQAVLYGPRIMLPSSTLSIHEESPFVRVTGKTSNITEITMNGTPISVTEDGSFDEPYLLVPGENRITFDAKDKYGRETHESVTVFYSSPEEKSLPIIPSTPEENPGPATETEVSTSTEEVAPLE